MSLKRNLLMFAAYITALVNALDRPNVLGLVATDGGGVRALRGLPRTLELEVGWRF